MSYVRFLVTAQTRGRANFASMHMSSARHFRDQTFAAEARYPPSKDSFSPPEYVHCWSAAVVFSAMSLEAYVYELMTYPDRFEPALIPALSFDPHDHWKEVLERYSLVFEKVCGIKLNTGRGPPQAAKVLVKLRNELVHSKAEWRDTATLSKALHSACRKRFALNPYLSGDHFFPDQCMSAASAAWAVRTAEEFLAYFSKATNARPSV